jgi:hypothetical protein
LHIRNQVLLNGPEILQLLVEVTRQQQHGVFELTFAIVKRALANDEPADWPTAHGGFDAEGGGAVCHRS